MAKVDKYALFTNYMKQAKAAKVDIDLSVFAAVVEKLGPANYNPDAQLVATADPAELERVYTNFVADELKISDKATGMKLIKRGVVKMKAIKRKYRAVFYYVLTQLAK
ncbi:MAG: hypothetical protein RI911_285 [Candidatus Parcubacteria bacterium]|jgi:hypothetical protein